MQIQVRPSGPAPAKIMLVGEAPGEQEVAKGEPFVGMSGLELSRMLQEAGIIRSTCFITNVVRVRPPGNDVSAFISMRKSDTTAQHALVRDKMCLPPIWEGIEMLKREIELVRPNIIIAFGNVAMWALTGKWGITSWRGSTLQTDLTLGLDYQPKVIPCYHPAAILRQWSWRQILVHDLRRAKVLSTTKDLIRPDYRFTTRPDFSTVCDYLDLLQKAVESKPLLLSVDIETRAGHIACIGFAWSRLEALCIPLMCAERVEGYWTIEEEIELMWRLALLLTHRNCRVIGQNFSYDAQYFHRWLHYLPNLEFDTMLAQHVCFSNVQKGLDFLSSMYCEFHEYWKDEGKEWDAKTGEDQLWTYNCKDAVITYEVAEVERKTIESMKLSTVSEFQQKLFWPVLQTMNRGIRVDKDKRNRFTLELMDEIHKRNQWLFDVLGYELNIASPVQMQELFYGQLGYKPVVNRKTGTITCNDEALGKIADRDPLIKPVIRKIQELRSLGVFLATFVRAPLDVDGRMRCSFNIAGTETFRFSSSKNAFGSGLNLQNIPKGGDDGERDLDLPNVRSLFIPDLGYTFFDIDLDSADLRIVAAEAGIVEMRAMLDEGKKVYVEVMKEYYKDQTMTKHHQKYGTFKSLCHGTHYLGSAKGLAERLGLSVSEVEKLQKWYYGKFPNLKRWQDDIKDQVLKRRMVENVFGYRQYFFDRIEGTIFNQAIAWIPQSTVGCLINRGYMNLHENNPEIEVLLQVHDSLAGQFPSTLGQAAVDTIIKACEIPLPYESPLIIPVGIKTSTESWGACG